MLFTISTRSVRQRGRIAEERALVICRITSVQKVGQCCTRLFGNGGIRIRNLQPFESRLGVILRACWRIESWVQSLTLYEWEVMGGNDWRRAMAAQCPQDCWSSFSHDSGNKVCGGFWDHRDPRVDVQEWVAAKADEGAKEV